MEEKFKVALEKFIAHANELRAAHYKRMGFNNISPEKIVATFDGKKYIRVVNASHTGSGGSVYCFIERETGNVLKSASWKAPAKGVRGNIFAETPDGYGITEYGAKYNS